MGLIQDIKTIVKSEEMQRKLDKLTTGKAFDEKTDIKGFRTTSYQTGDGSKATGNEGNGPPADGVAGDGTEVTPEQSTASTSGPASNTSNTNTTYNDTGLNSSSSLGASFSTGALNSLGTNMSGNVSTGGGGGNQAGTQTAAQEGANEATLQATLTAIDGMAGLTTEQKTSLKDQATRQWMIENNKIAPGYYTGRDVADNKSYVPKADKHTTLNTSVSITDLDQKQKINGIIGFDIDGDTNADGSVKAVQVNLDKYDDYVPSIQFPKPTGWDDADTPATLESYIAGRVWTVVWGSTRLFSNSFEGLLTEISNLTGSSYTSYGTDDATPDSASTVSNAPAVYTNSGVLYSLNTSGSVGDTFGSIGGTIKIIVGVAATGGLSEVANVPCGTYAGDTTACSATAPKETTWRDEGAYYLAYLKGKYVYNAYDSLVPLKWQQVVSAIDIALGDGVNVVDTRTMSIEPSYNGGTVLSVKAGDGSFTSATLLDSQGVPIDQTSSADTAKYWKPLGAD